ncbi:MAG: imidazoleglycerol-phosphate dehydratase [Thermoplasmatota archaeon]
MSPDVSVPLAEIVRETRESRIQLRISRGGGLAPRVEMEPAFARHMFETLGKWSGFDIDLRAVSKDGIEHHAVEDSAIAVGRGLRQLIDPGRIERVATAIVPMDDALVLASVDLVERGWYEGPIPDTMMEHVLRSIATEAAINLHIVVMRGKDEHHITEAAFKAFAKALSDATRPRADRLSTKGAVEFRMERS